MSADLSQFYQVFFDETAEHLDGMEKLLLALDVSNPSMDNLNAIFRAAHSIKGGAATFGFEDMTEVTHILETLLDRLRKQEMTVTGEMVNVFLEAKDVIAMQLAAHRGEGDVNADAVSTVCAKLERLSATPGSAPSGSGLKGGGGSSGGFNNPDAKVESGVSGKDSNTDDSDSGDSDSGFFDDQPGAPKVSSPPVAVASPKLPDSGAKKELHGQGFGLFDDEPATPARPPAALGTSTDRRMAEISARKEISGMQPTGVKPTGTKPSIPNPASSASTDTDFGFFDDAVSPPPLVSNAPKKPTDDDEADQKSKRDFHGKGYGFF